MEIIRATDYDDLCEKAAVMLISQVQQKPNAVLGLATGATPTGIYQKMVSDHQERGTSYAGVRTFNLDEYVGLPPEHPSSFAYYMRKQLFDRIDLPLAQTHIPSGIAADLEQECRQYEEAILAAGGIDMQILGIGMNGHIGFNEPGTPFQSVTHVVTLTESTRKANRRYFDEGETMPSHAITMGLATIMRSKRIVLLVSGKHKAPILHRLLNEPVSEDLPASILKQHSHVTVIADADAWDQ
ncbi:glucosamine-6-phosphate deaminase [Laceyella sacchari]|uniref:Glucosamine-6-phosphate deaminase n=1 Tax=Laceyella sacchari TaxID=37482 RepID=A0ABY5U614_LACSH|nr:glucosamine-6-phosphate deaminase [Laceyella sacchari]UWE05081.1 glucosamine-6-phosphate deaminase [Laceyella sacchari]